MTEEQAPLTRRQLRELEAQSVPPALSLARAYPRRADVATRQRAAKSGRSSVRIQGGRRGPGGSGAPSTARRAHSSLVSMGAMLFAAAMLVGLSVPANLFQSEPSATGDERILSSADAAVVPASQSIAVGEDAIIAAPARDGYSVTSYAEMLRLKYADVDYTYAATTGPVRWPFPYSVPVSSGFGERDGGFHRGVDFTPGGGSPIYAIADGVATISTADGTYGQYVILSHNINGQPLDTLYAHMVSGSSPIVTGQEVKVGDFLGLVGDTGIAYGAHLHFEVRLDGVSVDPFAWLQANAVN